MSDSDINSPPSVVIEAFTSAAITTLQELISVEAHFEHCQLGGKVKTEEPNVVAAICLRREHPGSMQLILAPETASQLAAHYLPTGTVLTEEIIDDVAGEFANVIAGQAKTLLKGTTSHFQLATPVVTRTFEFGASLDPNKAVLLTLQTTTLGQIRMAIILPP